MKSKFITGDKVTFVRVPRKYLCKADGTDACCKKYIGHTGIITQIDQRGALKVFENNKIDDSFCSGFSPESFEISGWNKANSESLQEVIDREVNRLT